jgi:hypothetical protein
MTRTSQAPGAGRVEREPIDYDYYRARAQALRQQAKRDVPRALFEAVRRLLRNSRPVSAGSKISLR